MLKVKIDDVDVEIIRALQRDAKARFSEIAKRCGVSTDTISRRFRIMRNKGVIRGTTILLDPSKFGYNCIASICIDVHYPYSDSIDKLMESISEIIFFTHSIGRNDIFCIAILPDVDWLSKVKDKIKAHPGVKNVTTSIWIDEFRLCPENFEFEKEGYQLG